MLQAGDLAPAFRVQPVFGLPVQTSGRPLVVLFLRSLSGGLARAAVAQAQRALPTLDAAGVGMVAFTRCDLTMARDYVPREHVLFPIVVEPDGARFEAWGVGRDKGFVRSLTGLRPATVRTAFASLGLARARPEGGVDQLPAEFLVGADGHLRYAHYGRTIFDLPDVEALCAALP
ncbi:MAG: peroxiredoxin-like family protein [Pseudomonadota bacterium]|nr:peroxiredoxin-like family protein [Pseudomonadota bacterium]